MNKIIIAIIGLPGCGKTEVINYLMDKLKCPKVYFGDVVFDVMKEKNLEINEINERQTREKLREQYGMAAMAIKSLPKIEEQLEKQNIVLIESLYSWEEYLTLKEKFSDQLKMAAVYSSPQTRINRLKNRPKRPLTADEVNSRDKAQIENLHQAGPIAVADYTIVNEGSVEELRQQMDNILKTLNPKS